MRNPQYTLTYLKRLAKRLKKERGITNTEALEVVAKENGYSNWKDCLQAYSNQRTTNVETSHTSFQIRFTDWLKKHKNRNSPLGDLASDMLHDKTWPSKDSLEEYRSYLSFEKDASWAAIEALENAWKTYKAYLKRKNSPTKPKAYTPKPKNHDLRKIIFVKNVTPVHVTKRTVEIFASGDKAWISWDGSKAIPVTVTKVDEMSYSLRIERPLKKAGDHYYLLLDEVRSTPELACMNRVS